MAFTLIAHVVGGSSNGNGFTTSSIDTTGADLLVLALVENNTTTTVSDNKGNTWSPLPRQGAGTSLMLYYVKNPAVGSLTPAATGELFVTGALIDNQGTTTLSINSSFTISDQEALGGGGNNYGVGLAYKIKTDALAENPTWSWTNSQTNARTVMTAFNPSTGGGGFDPSTVPWPVPLAETSQTTLVEF